MPRKLKANAFSQEVCNWLNRRTRFGDHISWKPDYRLDQKGRDFVDVVGLSGSSKKKVPKVLVEVELHREDPVSNVWKWANERGETRLYFFHAFSKLY